jgi:predicted aspartyl protease
MSHSYLDTYYPAMPALKILLGYPGESLTVGPITAIMDTGADSTLIPQSLVDELGDPFSDEARLRSHWGEWRNVSLFTIDFSIENLRLPAIEVIGDEQGQEIILGRNVLNRLKLLMDGPANQSTVLTN